MRGSLAHCLASEAVYKKDVVVIKVHTQVHTHIRAHNNAQFVINKFLPKIVNNSSKRVKH